MTRRRPELKELPFVLVAPVKNRVVITASSMLAEQQGAFAGMAAADARAAVAELVTLDDTPGQATKLLYLLGLACIRYTPIVSIDPPDGLMLDISGCAHLWGDERGYYKEVIFKLRKNGFDARAAIADTPGVAWAVARFGEKYPIIETGKQALAIADLPPTALRLDAEIVDRLQRLGFRRIAPLLELPAQMLRRRFGKELLLRIDQTLGRIEEHRETLTPPVPYVERLPCMEPIRTALGIEIAIERLLSAICLRLQAENRGIRKAFLKCHRIDGRKVQVSISTSKGSYSVSHLMRLFKLQVGKIEPALGIELFVLEASIVEEMDIVQEQLWAEAKGLADTALAELLDRVAGKVGANNICRFLPVEHHWPERSVKVASSLTEKPETDWQVQLRPIRTLSVPEPIEVMALIPDHPPKVFTYKNKRHVIKKADGPERIGREWWRDSGEHRDYYALEDSEGQRYWVFRSGHYDGNDARWYLHGYFA
ncbi:MAG: Y-family DNA polymerase [Mucilaginibacter sp.]